MTNILRLIKKYDDLNDTEKLSHPDLAQDIAWIQNHIDSWTGIEKNHATDFLKNLQGDLKNKIHEIEEELKNKPEAMQHVQKTMEACLAYSKTHTTKE